MFGVDFMWSFFQLFRVHFRWWRTSTGWQLYAISLAMWPSTIFVWQWCEQIFDHNNPKFFICLRWVCEYYIASCSATYLQLFRWFEDFNSYHGPCACPFVLTLVRYFFCGVAQCKQPPAGLNQVVWLPTMAQGTGDGCVRDGVQGWLEISLSAFFDDPKSIFRRGTG